MTAPLVAQQKVRTTPRLAQKALREKTIGEPKVKRERKSSDHKVAFGNSENTPNQASASKRKTIVKKEPTRHVVKDEEKIIVKKELKRGHSRVKKEEKKVKVEKKEHVVKKEHKTKEEKEIKGNRVTEIFEEHIAIKKESKEEVKEERKQILFTRCFSRKNISDAIGGFFFLSWAKEREGKEGGRGEEARAQSSKTEGGKVMFTYFSRKTSRKLSDHRR